MENHSEALKTFLSRTPFFGGLDDAALDLLVGMLEERSCNPGAAIFREGETGRSMYIIASGEVAMYRTGESGRQVKLVRLGTGDFFGETTLIEMQPRPCTAFVECPTTLFELSHADLYRLYRENLKAYVLILQNINRELCRRLRKADGRITEFADEHEDERTQISPVPQKPVPRPS